MNMRLFTSYISYLALLPALLLSSCQDDEIAGYDYTRAGEDVTVTVPVSLPGMDVKSRADLPEWQTDHVESLWIRTYSSVTGLATSEWKKLEPDSRDTEVERSVTIESKSGPSYIVAVANVENPGVSKDAPETQRPLSELLDEADTWAGFLNIAVVAPSTYETVNAPHTPLPMAGAYTNIKVGGHDQSPRRLDDWQAENFHAYTIPASGDGTVSLTNGAIHLRRLVSQVTFNLIAGDDIVLTPNSFRVVNVPRYSWLYERSTIDGMTANFGDDCTEETSGSYYAAPAQYSGPTIEEGETAGSWTFNFWQAENKHNAVSDIDAYGQRQEQIWSVVVPDGSDDNHPNEQWKENTGLFKALTGQTWTPNNMATYVEINCGVRHEGRLNVDSEGMVSPDGEEVVRSGTATYMVHLGYMDEDARDFNCFRNTRYTYNVTVNGLNDIRVEAFHHGDTHGANGLVSDVANPTFMLDCHYHTFNIRLEDQELTPFNPENGEGFGFMLTTFDGGVEHTYQEYDFVNVADYNAIDGNIKKYIDWVELRPTDGENVLATYKPRTGTNADGKTFNLIDATKGISQTQRSASGYYTVFVNEYSYEADGANEEGVDWKNYVYQDPRHFYIKVSRSISADGQSVYARSKYAGTQQSIMTYYSLDSSVETEPENATQVRGSAIGVERTNESFGLNLRHSFSSVSDPTNGRYNCWQFTRYRHSGRDNNNWTAANNGTLNNGTAWSYFVDQTAPQEIPAGNTGMPAQTIASGNVVKLPRIHAYRGTLTGNNAVNQYSPQPNANNRGNNAIIEAISACMNRNRDNNGDGIITEDELRWYVPAMGKYLRLILGNSALDKPLMEYNKITKMPYGPFDIGDGVMSSGNAHSGRYLFFGSEGRVLWAMEGLSTSNWCEWGVDNPVAPWEVRCIRNLGTNLSASIQATDKTVPAYTHRTTGDGGRGGIVSMTYYENVNAVRHTAYFGNGKNEGQMPVHTIDNRTYNSVYQSFEISAPDVNNVLTSGNNRTYYDGVMSGWSNNSNAWIVIRDNIQSDVVGNNNPNPCTRKGDGWRIPNLKEFAIMKNLGYFDGAANNFFITCTMGAFDYQGNKTTPETNTGVQHYIMSGRSDRITQSLGTQYYVRCVRDYNP